MKKTIQTIFIGSLLIGSIISANASKIHGVRKDQIDHFEIKHSSNTICSLFLDLKANDQELIKRYESDTTLSKDNTLNISVAMDALARSQYALLQANCGLNPLFLMGIDTLSSTHIASYFQIIVVMKNGSTISVPGHTSIFQFTHCEDSYGNQDACFENKTYLVFDMVKFL